MEAKRFKIRLIAIALAIPMLFAACNSDEPMLTPEEEFAIKNGSDVEYSKALLFEIDKMNWLTEYDRVKNIYKTTMMPGLVTYKIQNGVELSDKLMVTKIVKEKDGKFEVLDISSVKGDNYLEYNSDRLKITNKPESVEILYQFGDLPWVEDLSWNYDYCYYHIYISDSKETYGTKIIINALPMYTGYGSLISFDTSIIKYPFKYGYDKKIGLKNEYLIYLPSEECNIKLVTNETDFFPAKILLYENNNDAIELYSIDKKIDFLNQSYVKYEGTEFKTDKLEYNISTQCMNLNFAGLRVADKNEYSFESSLECNISENTGQQERFIELLLKDADYCFSYATIKFIQTAK